VTGPPLEGMKTAPPPKPAAELKTEETPAAKKPPTEAGAKDKPSETVRPAENPATVAAKDTPVKTEASPTKGVTRLPRLHKQVDPVYPEDALREGIDGDVILNLSVGFDGRVERAAVVKSIPKLDAAAVAAARQWEFEPGLLEGIPIQATLQVTIHFGLPPGTVRTKGGNEEVKTEIPVRNTKKPAENPPPAPQDDLSRGRSLLERGARVEALALARKILASNPNQDEAKALAMDAVIQLAPGEIKSLVDEYAASTKAGRTVEFFRRHARSDVFNRLRDDLEAMANAVRDIQVTVSDLNLEFQTARYPDFQTRAVFSQVMTGIPSAKLYREVLFEGRYAWVLERRENDWVIVSVGVE
jgi:TonB family protein